MTPTSEFSRIVTIEPWPADGIAVDVIATDAECQLLKERFDLVGIKSLKALGKIERAGDGLLFDGTLEAEVTQSCVVSLAPVPSIVKTSFQRRYLQSEHGTTELDPDDADIDGDEADTDILEGDHIDVGEVIAEEFCLALDSYPRAKDADAVMAEVQDVLNQDDVPLPDSPFAKLRRH